MRLSSLGRWFLAVAAALQVMLPGPASIADGLLSLDLSRSSVPAVHIESHSSGSCHRVHPDDCALCNIVSSVANTRLPSAVIPLAVRQTARQDDSSCVVARDVWRRLPPPRGPPVSSLIA